MNELLWFLFGLLCAFPLRIVFGVFTICTFGKGGFRWVLKWERFDD